jgi:hypothetical protein
MYIHVYIYITIYIYTIQIIYHTWIHLPKLLYFVSLVSLVCDMNLWRPERSTADVDAAAAESSPDKIVNVNVGRHQFNVLPSWKPVGSGDSQIKGNTKMRKKKIPKRFFLWHACFHGDKLLFVSWKVSHLCEALGMVVPGLPSMAPVLQDQHFLMVDENRAGSITKLSYAVWLYQHHWIKVLI